jgi:hypothetical protein
MLDMPPIIKSRKLEVFKLHCRQGQTKVDYIESFSRLSRARNSVRQFEVDDKLLALPRLRLNRSTMLVEFIAYEGPIGVNPLIFDSGSGIERFETLTQTQVVATRTYGIIDLNKREAIIEYNQRGAKAQDVGLLLEESGRRLGLGEDFSVEFTPLADDSFLDSIDQFGRIRLATMRVARPNFDWTDNHDGLSQVGAESNGRSVELTVTAHRSDSLAHNKGIIQYIRDMVLESVATLKGATVVGMRHGESAETRVSLANHIVHQKVQVEVDGNGHIVGRDIQNKLREFSHSRTRNRIQ